MMWDKLRRCMLTGFLVFTVALNVKLNQDIVALVLSALTGVMLYLAIESKT